MHDIHDMRPQKQCSWRHIAIYAPNKSRIHTDTHEHAYLDPWSLLWNHEDEAAGVMEPAGELRFGSEHENVVKGCDVYV